MRAVLDGREREGGAGQPLNFECSECEQFARIRGIQRKLPPSSATANVVLTHDSERILARHIIKLHEVVAEMESELTPNALCDYLYELSQKFNVFYELCPVLGSEHQESRAILCTATAMALRLGLDLLGIETLERM